MKGIDKVDEEKMVIAPTFYLQRVSTADWAFPLVLVAAPPP